MVNIIKRSPLFLILFPSALSFSQELLTPEEAVRIALENNYSISVARNEAEIADNNYDIGNAGMLPEVDANGAFSRSITDAHQEFFDGRVQDRNNAETTNLNASIALNWTIFDGLAMFAGLSRLKSLRETGELNLKSEIENNVASVISTYYEIVSLQEVIEVIRSNIEISEERVKIAEAELEVGSGSRFDLRQAQVDLNEDRSSLLREEQNLFQSKVLLNQLLARETTENFTVADTIILLNDLELENLRTLVKGNNNTLKIAEENKLISENEIMLARSGFFPRISLSGGYNFTRVEAGAGILELNRSSGFNYGLTASWNLFNGLNTSRNIENAELNLRSSEMLYLETEQSIEAGLQNTFTRFRNSLEIVALENQNLLAAQENLDVALERLRLGNITPLEFRETQINLFGAKSRLVSAQFEAKDAETQLLRLSGQLIKGE